MVSSNPLTPEVIRRLLKKLNYAHGHYYGHWLRAQNQRLQEQREQEMLYFLLRENRNRENKRNLIASTFLPTEERIPYVSEFAQFGETWLKAFEATLNCLQEKLLKAVDNAVSEGKLDVQTAEQVKTSFRNIQSSAVISRVTHYFNQLALDPSAAPCEKGEDFNQMPIEFRQQAEKLWQIFRADSLERAVTGLAIFNSYA